MVFYNFNQLLLYKLNNFLPLQHIRFFISKQTKMSRIQSFKMPGTVSSMDWHVNNKQFIAGGKQTIKIIDFNTDNEYWFKCLKTINKHKNASMTKVCVSQLAWNKCQMSTDFVACGTTSGFVFVYDVSQNAPKSVFSVKGHDGNIKNILWVPNSKDMFISSSYQNQINLWDRRVPQNPPEKIQYPQSIKIRDIKFNPHDPNIIGVQCSSAIKIVDLRKLKEQIVSKHIKDNQLQGYMMQWDPHDKYRLASGVSKQVNILNWEGSDLKLQESLSHYSLIKAFRWLKTKKNYFGISGQNPEKNICFYDLADKDRVSYMYAGHSKSIDCWTMDDNEKIILSASNTKEKNPTKGSALKTSQGQIVAQYSDNYIDPNQTRLQHPLAFDNNSSLVFNLTINDPQAPTEFKNSRRYRYSFPTIYLQEEQTQNKKVLTLRDQIIYLHENYLFQGKNDVIAQSNCQTAMQCNKVRCAEFWRVMFLIAYPEEVKEPTLQAIYEAKIKADVVFDENRIYLYNKSALKLEQKRVNINLLIQQLADQNQLQTAVIASIVLINKSPQLIDQHLFDQILSPYMQILRNLQLYTIASETLVMLPKIQKFEKFNNATAKDTLYRIICGWCKQSVTKGECKCNLLCVLCQERLNQRMVIWCKYCGHGGHALEYKKWFETNRYCPHGCQHQCFKPEDFY